jgi:hypothetical protein
MPGELIWYGLSLVALVTAYWFAVWWWLPKIARDRERDRDSKPR